MGLTLSQRRAVTEAIATRYKRADKAGKTAAEIALLNKIWISQSLLANYFYPQQKLTSKTRHGATVIKNYDRATTPHRRAHGHDAIADEDKNILTDTYTELDPAALQREIQALTDRLLKITTSKAGPWPNPATGPPPRAHRPRGRPLPARSGAGRLALTVPEVRVVGVAVTGAVDIARFPRRPWIRVEFFDPAGGRPRPGETAIGLTKRIMAEVRAAAPYAVPGRRRKAAGYRLAVEEYLAHRHR